MEIVLIIVTCLLLCAAMISYADVVRTRMVQKALERPDPVWESTQWKIIDRREYPETHRQGHLSVENAEAVAGMDLTDCDLGVQIAEDGRVWLCVNGVAWLRFKPNRGSDGRPPQ